MFKMVHPPSRVRLLLFAKHDGLFNENFSYVKISFEIKIWYLWLRGIVNLGRVTRWTIRVLSTMKDRLPIFVRRSVRSSGIQPLFNRFRLLAFVVLLFSLIVRSREKKQHFLRLLKLFIQFFRLKSKNFKKKEYDRALPQTSPFTQEQKIFDIQSVGLIRIRYISLSLIIGWYL